eukprot:COSAG03_NODE_12342_length_551_cov_1.314159_1_plen_37_part_10
MLIDVLVAQVDQKELDEKLQVALEKVRADFDTAGVAE